LSSFVIELEDSRREAKVASKSAEDASAIIGDLRIEVAGLKRRLGKVEATQQIAAALAQATGSKQVKKIRGLDGKLVEVKEEEEFNDFARAPTGDILDGHVNNMFNKLKLKDGSFAKDARELFAAAESEFEWEIGAASASEDLRRSEQTMSLSKGTGSGLGILESPAGLRNHGAVLARSINPSSVTLMGERVSTTSNTASVSLPAVDGAFTTSGPQTNQTNNVGVENSNSQGGQQATQQWGSVLNRQMDIATAMSLSSNPGGPTQGDITAFQHWKMKNFLWAPDTPEASKNYDEWAVQRLTDATLKEALSPSKINADAVNSDDPKLASLRRPTQGAVVKVNDVRLGKARRGPLPTSGVLGLPDDTSSNNNRQSRTIVTRNGAGLLGTQYHVVKGQPWGSIGKFPPSLKPGHGLVKKEGKKADYGSNKPVLKPLSRQTTKNSEQQEDLGKTETEGCDVADDSDDDVSVNSDGLKHGEKARLAQEEEEEELMRAQEKQVATAVVEEEEPTVLVI